MALHILSGTGAPTTAPAFIGQHYIDTTGVVHYLANGTSGPSDWQQVGAGGGGGGQPLSRTTQSGPTYTWDPTVNEILNFNTSGGVANTISLDVAAGALTNTQGIRGRLVVQQTALIAPTSISLGVTGNLAAFTVVIQDNVTTPANAAQSTGTFGVTSASLNTGSDTVQVYELFSAEVNNFGTQPVIMVTRIMDLLGTGA